MARFCSVVALGSVLALGCGAGQQKASDSALVTAPAPSATASEEPPDLSPVVAPSDVVALGRFKNPRLAFDTAAKWGGFPLSLADVLPSEARAIAKVVNWEAPIDVVVALDARGEGKVPQPLGVVSIGLTSLPDAVAEARAAGATVRRVQPGVFRTSLGEPQNCAIAASVGKAPARLVCGDRFRDVEELLGYATRGLPLQSLGEADFVADLRFEPIQRRYSRDLASLRLFLGLALRQIQLDSPRFDRALGDVAYALADEVVALATDLDRARIEAVLDQKTDQLMFSASLEFKAQSSWLVQTLQSTPAGPAPPELFRLPQDVKSASFAYRASRERLAPLAKALSELAEGYFDAQKLPRASRERWRTLVERAFGFGARSATGQGEFPALADKDPLAQNALKDLGWTLMFVPDRADQVKSFLSDLVAALDDPAFRKLLKEKLEIDDKLLPRFKKRALNLAKFKGQALLVEATVNSELLSRFDMLGDGSKGKQAAGKLVAIAAPDPDGTWIGFGPDEKRLVAKMAELGSDGNKGHEQIRTLGQVTAVTGGFYTLAGILSSYRFLAAGRDVDGLMNALPARGATPMITLGTVERAGAATVLRGRIAVPRAVLADAVALTPLLATGVLAGPVGRAPPPPLKSP